MILMEKPFNSLDAAFGGSDGSGYITPPSPDAVVAEVSKEPEPEPQPESPQVEVVAVPAAEPIPAQQLASDVPQIPEQPVEAPVEQQVKQESGPSEEERADHARLKEIGFFALNDLTKALEATKSLGRIIDDYGPDGGEEEADQRPLLDGLYLSLVDGDAKVYHHDEDSFERQIEAANNGVQTAQKKLNEIGFLASIFGNQKKELESEISRLTRNKNAASSKIRRVKGLVDEVQKFCRQIPKPFLSEVGSGDVSLGDFIDKVQPKLDEALALKRKYPKYREILGMAIGY